MSKFGFRPAIGIAIAVFTAGCAAVPDQQVTSDWISYGGDPGGMRYAAHD